ncbi:MAG: S-layer homology domain-containing protein [Firmicutes bacterium]|nr:S-layer homology domain-containing protein [Bacillota bacterium]
MKTKKMISALLAVCLLLSLLPALGMSAAATGGETLYSCGFETEAELEQWSFVDADGDGQGWVRKVDDGGVGNAYGHTEGNCALFSYSFDNNTNLPLTPDNKAYSPEIEIPASGDVYLTYDVFAQSPLKTAEHYSVYVFAAGKGETLLFSETLAKGEDCDTPAHRELSLSEYVGQTVHIVFRHHEASDQFAIGIDAVKVQRKQEITGVAVMTDEPVLDMSITTAANLPDCYEGYTIANVAWDPSDAKFELDKVYTVVVTLEAEEGYVFPESVKPYINGKVAKVIYQSADEMKISYTFPKLQEISGVAVMTDEPVLDMSITTAANLPDCYEGYTIANVSWDPSDAKFEPDKVYTVVVTLEAEEGYVFPESVKPYINGKLAKIVSQSAKEMKVSYTFPKVQSPMPSMFFDDVKTSDWFYGDVEYAYYNRIMNGVGNNKFDPNGNCTRAMIVTVLYRIENSPTHSGKNPFKDVKAGEWYTEAIIWAAENEIVKGVGEGKFAPEANITREQLATILCRYAQFKGVYDSEDCAMLAGFADYAKVSSWAADSVSWAVGTGMITGSNEKDGLYLMPAGNASRCQVAAIFHRFCTTF